ncbi:MAG: hypothetical protein KME57_34960 [Scytonema hyalinum WJT4-NPBG1]|nr:hypothetical protein [Scytonema hyalinum WJT4-NPBG1]
MKLIVLRLALPLPVGRSRIDSTWLLPEYCSTFLQRSLSELGTSPSELETSPSELETSPSELGTSPSELETSPSELETSPLELETSPSELETSPSELETSPSELGTSPSELETSPSELETSASEQSHQTNISDWAINSTRAWRWHKVPAERSQTSTLPAHGDGTKCPLSDRPKIQSQDSFQIKKHPKFSCGMGVPTRPIFRTARMPTRWIIYFLEISYLEMEWGRLVTQVREAAAPSYAFPA